nr:MAG TPA: toxin [Caudoviricetes sp.]
MTGITLSDLVSGTLLSIGMIMIASIILGVMLLIFVNWLDKR